MNRHSLIIPVFLTISLSACVIWIRTLTVKETYSFIQAEKKLVLAKQEIQSLRLKWSRTTSPQRLAHFSRELDLLPPRLDQIVKYSQLKIKSR